MVQWGDYLAASRTLFPFFLYAFSGIIVTVIFVILIFKEEGSGFNLFLSLKRETVILRPFEPGDRSIALTQDRYREHSSANQ